MNLMKKNLLKMLAVLLLTAGAGTACNKPESDAGPNAPASGFSKTTMLEYYADSLIVPGYATLLQRLRELKTASDNLLSAPSATTQAAVKTAYTAARMQHARVAAFQFGPAEDALLDLYLNFSGGLDYSFSTAGELTGFSIDTAAIERNIQNGSYNLAAVTRSSFYAQGFAALDYLYFAPQAIEKLQGPTPVGRITYIQNVLTRIETLVSNVANAWPSYRATFVANTETNVGSPIGNLVNQLAYQMDLLKGPRIGWPAGRQSNGTAFPQKVEAYHAGISMALATENLLSLRRIYTAGNSGKGLSDYLIALNQGQLNTDVLAQFDIAIEKLRAIPDPLSESLRTHTPQVDAAYKDIQKLLTLLKTDVASATSVSITFMDNDGD
jgi:predicted lipoprotein